MNEKANQKPVVIVEDNDTCRHYMEEILHFKGINIIAFYDSRDALLYMIHNEPDLVIMDIKLPHVNGINLSRILTTCYPDISIIAVSADICNKNMREKCLTAGCCDFISKPFFPEELRKCVSKYI